MNNKYDTLIGGIIMELLARTRKINAMLQNTGGKPVNFKEMSETLCDVIEANVFIVRRRGKLLGFAITSTN